MRLSTSTFWPSPRQPTNKISNAQWYSDLMDKKAKKRIDILRQRIQKLKLQMSGAKQQDDEPGQIEQLEKEIADATAEIESLKKS